MDSSANKTVLVCDDDEDLLFLAKSFLSKKNITVLKATTGQDAINIYKEQSNLIKAVILDNTFKNSDLQGKDILVLLKKIDPKIKILISSGYPKEYFKDHYPRDIFSLIDGFIDKNYSSPDFIKTLQSFLE